MCVNTTVDEKGANEAKLCREKALKFKKELVEKTKERW